MKIRIPDDDERKDIRNMIVRSDIGIGLKKWLKIQMDILVKLLLGNFRGGQNEANQLTRATQKRGGEQP